MANSAKIYTVARLNQEAKNLLETGLGTLWVEAEISNLSMPVSGHWYFTLKDNRAQVRCAMFKGRNRLVTFRPEHGNKVLVRAKLSLYEPRGDYQLIVESMKMAGDGRLQQQFEALKLKLATEGLFAQAHKKSLPAYPQKIGIVTSSTGAALQDILQILARRDPNLEIIIYPAQVQGALAAQQVAQQIALANARHEVDILIVGRGGGSLEDLWCFNEEIVARTIYASELPIVSAVGHETDVSISDFVADVRAPTPSAAAELVSRDIEQLMQALDYKEKMLTFSINNYVQSCQRKITQTLARLQQQDPQARLKAQAQHLALNQQHLNQLMRSWLEKYQRELQQKSEKLAAMPHYLEKYQHKLALQAQKLQAYSPLATLSRGYSISLNAQQKIVRSIDDIQLEDSLLTRVDDGVIKSKVVSKKSS